VNRVVRHLASSGIRQFVDVGSGVLSHGNTHQVADEISPDCRVVYVENEAVAFAHAEMVLDEEGDPDRHAVVDADLSCPDDLWHQVRDTEILDPNEPVVLLMFSVLHTLSPGTGVDPAYGLMARYRDLLQPGSYLGVSHVTNEGVPPALTSKLVELKRLCDEAGGSDVHCRSRAAVKNFLGDFQPVGPGLGWIPDWYREDVMRATDNVLFTASNHAVIWAGVGRKKRRGRLGTRSRR
jgi:hypothetical protein